MKEEAKTKMVVVTEDSVSVDGVVLNMVTGVKIEVVGRQIPRVHITVAAPSSRGGVQFTGAAHVSRTVEKTPSDIIDQPVPTPHPELIPVWEIVIHDFKARYSDAFDGIEDDHVKRTAYRVEADMRERDRVGRERYGTPLTVNNGRDHLVDAYQEMLDAAVYMRSAWLEGAQVRDIYTLQLGIIMTTRQMIDARSA